MNDSIAKISTVCSTETSSNIYGFIARIDDREIVAQLKEKSTAQREYSEVLQAGHGTYLLEEDEKSQDNFIINVGALPSGKECQIIISYVTELNLVENDTKIRFVIPTNIAPRYNREKGGISLPAGTNATYVQSTSYRIDFCCQVEKFAVAGIGSPSNPIPMDMSKEDFYENKIGLARQAMLLFLKSLPVNCYFNIIRFGSNHRSLFPAVTTIYNEVNASKLSPLKWLDQNLPVRRRSRQIFLLTDGEISDVDQVLDLCRTMATSTRIFSFGLGASPSRSLVKGLARATNGRFVFIPPNTSVDVHVGEQLQKALQSCITNVQVKWHLGTTAIKTVPMKTPPVYFNDRLIVYALIDNSPTTFDHDSRVEFRSSQHRIAAKALILELQHAKETIKKRIIELSLKYNILSPHTSFIGVEKRMNANNTDMILREVPIQISADNQHLSTYSQSYSAATSSVFDCLVDDLVFLPGSFSSVQCVWDDLCATSTLDNIADELQPKSLMDMYIPSKCDYELCSVDSLQDKMTPPVKTNIFPIQIKKTWPTNDQDIVCYLIDRQKFDGYWQLDTEDIEQLTGKLLIEFKQMANNNTVLITVIVIALLETRFVSLSTMWYDVTKLDTLLKDIVIISGLQSYTNLNSFDRHLSDKNNNKSVSEIVRTTALASTTIIMKTILPEQDVSKPAIKDSGLPQALYIQDDFVAADDD
ncbi:hypothetical protein I4U23_023263 [Adineta vaga]|nr:hypothetical protein I4U23_023263 [Adineta vaga]